MTKQKMVYKITFLILSLVFFYFLSGRLIFLANKEETEAQILNLQKSEDESDLIVKLTYSVSNQIIHTNKKIKFSLMEDFRGKENVGILYNKKSPKDIYFKNYSSSVYGDIFILLIPTVLFFIGFLSVKK